MILALILASTLVAMPSPILFHSEITTPISTPVPTYKIAPGIVNTINSLKKKGWSISKGGIKKEWRF